MLTYRQSVGTLANADHVITGCYAGRDGMDAMKCKNDPASQAVMNWGPLPRNIYTLSPLHVVPHLGPCMALTPSPSGQMFDRSGFFIHLDNPAHVGFSSDGCIVVPSYADLELVETWRSYGEAQIQVVE